jgi:hypothetical protein
MPEKMSDYKRFLFAANFVRLSQEFKNNMAAGHFCVVDGS